MTAIYGPNGPRDVVLCFPDGEQRLAAVCDYPDTAAQFLNRARYANDVRRQYTNAARLIARAEALPGFAWVEV